jgi:hypothetical protein
MFQENSRKGRNSPTGLQKRVTFLTAKTLEKKDAARGSTERTLGAFPASLGQFLTERLFF